MGNLLANASRFVVRKTRRFNVENRAHKFIEKEKLPVAPKHPSTSEMLENLTKDPAIRDQLVKKNTQLDINLKDVYVKSLHDPIVTDEEKERRNKIKLPQDRRLVPDFKYGHEIPISVPKGKYTLSHAIELITAHHSDPIVNTPNVLAEKYNLDTKLVDSILFYFRFFKIEAAAEQKDQHKIAKQVMSSYAQNAMKKLKQSKESEEFKQPEHIVVDYYKDIQQVTKQELEERKKQKLLNKENKYNQTSSIGNNNFNKNVLFEGSQNEKDKIIKNKIADESLHKKIEQEEIIEDKDSIYKTVGNRKKQTKKNNSS